MDRRTQSRGDGDGDGRRETRDCGARLKRVWWMGMAAFGMQSRQPGEFSLGLAGGGEKVSMQEGGISMEKLVQGEAARANQNNYHRLQVRAVPTLVHCYAAEKKKITERQRAAVWETFCAKAVAHLSRLFSASLSSALPHKRSHATRNALPPPAGSQPSTHISFFAITCTFCTCSAPPARGTPMRVQALSPGSFSSHYPLSGNSKAALRCTTPALGLRGGQYQALGCKVRGLWQGMS